MADEDLWTDQGTDGAGGGWWTRARKIVGVFGRSWQWFWLLLRWTVDLDLSNTSLADAHVLPWRGGHWAAALPDGFCAVTRCSGIRQKTVSP